MGGRYSIKEGLGFLSLFAKDTYHNCTTLSRLVGPELLSGLRRHVVVGLGHSSHCHLVLAGWIVSVWQV